MFSFSVKIHSSDFPQSFCILPNCFLCKLSKFHENRTTERSIFSFTVLSFCAVIACSHRRHPVSNLQLFSLKYIENYWKLGNWKLSPEIGNCLVSNCVYTAYTDKTRQDSLVLSVSAVWTSY